MQVYCLPEAEIIFGNEELREGDLQLIQAFKRTTLL